jgi:hypothetical protein
MNIAGSSVAFHSEPDAVLVCTMGGFQLRLFSVNLGRDSSGDDHSLVFVIELLRGSLGFIGFV